MQFTDESFSLRVMGIDNGSSMLGMVIGDLDLRTGDLHIEQATTLVADKLVDQHQGLLNSHGARWVRQRTLGDQVVSALRFYNPHHVAVETPFFMPRRVQSFETLTEMMIFIRLAVEDYGLGADIYRITPGQAKRAVQPKNKNFTMKKAVIKDCVLAMENITYNKDLDKDALTEHEYDAIAVIQAHGQAIRAATGFLRP